MGNKDLHNNDDGDGEADDVRVDDLEYKISNKMI